MCENVMHELHTPTTLTSGQISTVLIRKRPMLIFTLNGVGESCSEMNLSECQVPSNVLGFC